VTIRALREQGLVLKVTPVGRSRCQTTVYRSTDGSTVASHPSGNSGETYTWFVKVDGEVWVQGDRNCTTYVTLGYDAPIQNLR
jgi:hypothetical protein